MINKFKKINIGVEIECIINSDIIDFISIGHYHDGNTLLNKDGKSVHDWVVEKDSSINYGQKFKKGIGIELVSKTFRSKKEFFRGIDRFIEVFSVNGKYELKDVLEINESCGCHIHFSKDNKYFAKTLHSHFYQSATRDFFNMLKKSNVSQNVKSGIRKQYYRKYAQKSSKVQFDRNRKGNGCGDRHSEWNFLSEEDDKGLEWRSFNVRDVETWKDFKYLMSIAFSTLKPLLLSLNGWKKGNIYSRSIENKEDIEETRKVRKMRNSYKSKKVSLRVIKSENIHIKKKNTEHIFKKMKNEEIEVGDRIKIMLINSIERGGN